MGGKRTHESLLCLAGNSNRLGGKGRLKTSDVRRLLAGVSSQHEQDDK